jgi:hypothetical protein
MQIRELVPFYPLDPDPEYNFFPDYGFGTFFSFLHYPQFRVETKTVFSIFAKSENEDNREVHVVVHYCCPICFEAPSGFDILRYFTIFPVSCVRFLIHFRFREIFVIFVTIRKLFSRKAKMNFREIFAKIRKRKFLFQPYLNFYY